MIKNEVNFQRGMKLIINADDFGICEERDRGILELFAKGYVSSATALVNFPNFEKSIEEARKLNLPIGLHLNLTEGEPIYDINIEHNSLVELNPLTNQFEFYGKFKFRERMKEGKILSADIKNEIIYQVYYT
jgi:predicted glycoside hydrolase/deacetylase ChbG (UPF0249 family)